MNEATLNTVYIQTRAQKYRVRFSCRLCYLNELHHSISFELNRADFYMKFLNNVICMVSHISCMNKRQLI